MTDDDDDAPTPTVTSPAGPSSDREMSLIGYAVAAGMVIALLPLVPLALVVWLVLKLLGVDANVDDEGGFDEWRRARAN